jgi:hypothetical protein
MHIEKTHIVKLLIRNSIHRYKMMVTGSSRSRVLISATNKYHCSTDSSSFICLRSRAECHERQMT